MTNSLHYKVWCCLHMKSTWEGPLLFLADLCFAVRTDHWSRQGLSSGEKAQSRPSEGQSASWAPKPYCDFYLIPIFADQSSTDYCGH